LFYSCVTQHAPVYVLVAKYFDGIPTGMGIAFRLLMGNRMGIMK